jgi:hypothetical protein
VAMTEAADVYTAGTSEDDFVSADIPEDPENFAGQDGDGEARWGYTTDPKTGERRPKKAPGRPKNQPGAEELAAREPVQREPDRKPERPEGRRPRPVVPDDDPKPLSKTEHSVIAAGVNKMYRRAGKAIRGLEGGDEEGIGAAFIYVTKADPDVPEDERELTVGEAWANLAKVNPRIRRWLLKLVAGGDIADLVMAHAPIGIALVMKPWVQRFLPGEKMMAVAASMAEPDEDEEGGSALGGLLPEDLRQMQDLTGDQAEQIARKMARGAGVKITEADIAEVRRRAEAATDAGIPPAFRRQQPKNRSRAQRAGSR